MHCMQTHTHAYTHMHIQLQRDLWDCVTQCTHSSASTHYIPYAYEIRLIPIAPARSPKRSRTRACTTKIPVARAHRRHKSELIGVARDEYIFGHTIAECFERKPNTNRLFSFNCPTKILTSWNIIPEINDIQSALMSNKLTHFYAAHCWSTYSPTHSPRLCYFFYLCMTNFHTITLPHVQTVFASTVCSVAIQIHTRAAES